MKILRWSSILIWVFLFHFNSFSFASQEIIQKNVKAISLDTSNVVKHSEAARFSYQEPHEINSKNEKYYVGEKSGEKYKVVNEFVSDSGKYRAVAFMDTNKNLYMSYRGTKDLGDLRTDAIIAINRPLSKITEKIGINLTIDNSLRKNVDRSEKFYQDTLEKLKNQKINHKDPIVVGHSLGGYMAQMVGHKTGAETHTFNAPGAMTANYYDSKGHTNNIINHIRSTDLISSWGKHIGIVALYQNSAKDGSLFTYPKDQHKLSYLTNDIHRGMKPKIYEHGQK